MIPTKGHVLCIKIDTSGHYPIYYADRDTCSRLGELLHDRATIWSVNPELALGIRRSRGRPGRPEFWIHEMRDLFSSHKIHLFRRGVEEVNAKFVMLALHTPGVWLQQLATILGVPVPTRKRVIDVWSGIQGTRVPTRWSRGFRPKYTIR